MRLQLALNVRNIDQAVAYYSDLFGVNPHKRRPGYANFAIDSPPLKLVLFENPDADERLNHLGVEVQKEAELDAVRERLDTTGLIQEEQRDSTCCHATQNKIWSHEPDGLRFEWYRIIDDEPELRVPEAEPTSCCATPSP
jgi:catechol 2,3-dioxygenase-like lactoylglutathione lyase family enzyme